VINPFLAVASNCKPYAVAAPLLTFKLKDEDEDENDDEKEMYDDNLSGFLCVQCAHSFSVLLPIVSDYCCG